MSFFQSLNYLYNDNYGRDRSYDGRDDREYDCGYYHDYGLIFLFLIISFHKLYQILQNLIGDI